MTEEPVCERLPDIAVALLGGGSTHLSHFQGQKLIVHFCPATAGLDLATYDALREEFASAGTWLITADTADTEAFHALQQHFPDARKAVPEDGGTFVIDRDGVPRYFWPGFGNAGEALIAACARP